MTPSRSEPASTPPPRRPWLGLACALFATAMWGMLPLALKVVLPVLDPFTITWSRFTVAALALGLILGASGHLPPVRRLPGLGWGLLALSIAALATNYLTYLIGLDYTTPANAQVVFQVCPILLATGGIVVFGERYARLQWIGMAILVVGLLTYFGGELRVLVTDSGRYLRGSLLIVISALAFVFYGLAQKRLIGWLGPQGILLCICCGCSVVLLGLARPGAIAELEPTELGFLLFCGLNTLLAYGAFSAALYHWDVSRVGAIQAQIPLATMGFATLASLVFESVPFARGTDSWTGLLGALGVVAGSMLMALGRAPAPAPPPVAPPPAPAPAPLPVSSSD